MKPFLEEEKKTQQAAETKPQIKTYLEYFIELRVGKLKKKNY